jgi:hypothetical protein
MSIKYAPALFSAMVCALAHGFFAWQALIGVGRHWKHSKVNRARLLGLSLCAVMVAPAGQVGAGEERARLSPLVAQQGESSKVPTLPMGMNLPQLNYYTPGLVFNDVMTTASPLISFSTITQQWDSQVMAQIPVDPQGWPLEIPYSVQGDPQGFRFLINSNYKGDYVVRYDGEGEITWGGVKVEVRDGVTHLMLPGTTTNVWATVVRSAKGNHIHNMRIIPATYAHNEQALPRFYPLYLKGLRPFQALRFMDWTGTNNSSQSNWSDRTKKDFYSQGTENGIAWEYVIELANTLHADPWICVPHQANDDYISKLSRLFLSKLDPDLSLYVEYSNEIWNWMFKQSHYVAGNAPGGKGKVVAGLRAVATRYCGGADTACHPEKDAWMMARTFRIFETTWSPQRSRLITVAAVQHSWPGNTGRILKFLWNDEEGFKADALSPGGYFGFSDDDHAKWVAMSPGAVTPEMILAAVDAGMPQRENLWTRETAQYAKQYGLAYLVYEGGQHMQPYQQKEWGYNHAVYDAQIHPGMYDLYMKNFAVHNEVDCKLFMAFAYVGPRESRWGSWGHLETLADIKSKALKTVAPKYKALLDASSSKN